MDVQPNFTGSGTSGSANEGRTGEFYTDDAARLAAEAARRRSAPRAAPRIKLPDGPVIISARERPPLSPAPPSNQNQPAPRPRGSFLRMVARVILAPWYLLMILASLAVIVLVFRILAHL